MNARILIVILAMSIAVAGEGQVAPILTEHLPVAVEIAGKRYCRGDGEMNVLQLDLRLSITNKAGTTVVLYLASPTIGRVNVARDVEALHAGDYETEFFPFTITEAGSGSEVKERLLVLLKPTTSTSLGRIVVPLPIRAAGVHLAGVVGAGRHVLRLNLETWPFDSRVSSKWSARTSQNGTLWTGSLVSLPLFFDVEPRPHLAKCD